MFAIYISITYDSWKVLEMILLAVSYNILFCCPNLEKYFLKLQKFNVFFCQPLSKLALFFQVSKVGPLLRLITKEEEVSLILLLFSGKVLVVKVVNNDCRNMTYLFHESLSVAKFS